MNSSWQNPLPSEKYINQQVVIYFYTGRWVPIMFYSFAAAIALSHQAKQSGKELFIFPTNALPHEFERPHPCSYSQQTSKPISSPTHLKVPEFAQAS